MKNLYNKGKYRSFEYAKHLRPFLKRIGNKKWRKTEKQEIENQLNPTDPPKGIIGERPHLSDSTPQSENSEP